MPDLADLAEWAVESRYPGAWPEGSSAEAAAMAAKAARVIEVMERDLLKRGVEVE